MFSHFFRRVRLPSATTRAQRPRLWALEDRTAPAVNSWLGGNADWTADPATNWSLGRLPDGTDDVQIANGATVTHGANGTTGGDQTLSISVTGDSTHSFEDTIIATKIRLLSESTGRPAIGVRFATKLPNATNESGLGLDTTDFFAALLGAKTVESIRVVANIGVGILADPTNGNRQNDVLTYGLSFARAMTQHTEVVGELNGRLSVREGDPFPGTESRGLLKLGGRYTQGPVRFDAGVFLGLTTIDPTIGFTVGFTYVFNAFTLP